MWKLLQNDSGVILNYWKLIWNDFFDQKVNILNISLDINSENVKNSNLTFKSQHLVMNPGQGPSSKCAPGQDSMKDSSLIQSHCLKRGVMDFQNQIFWFGAKSGWGQTLTRFAICRNPSQFNFFSEHFGTGNTPTRINPRPKARDVCSKARICIKKWIWEAFWRSVPRSRIVLFFWVGLQKTI